MSLRFPTNRFRKRGWALIIAAAIAGSVPKEGQTSKYTGPQSAVVVVRVEEAVGWKPPFHMHPRVWWDFRLAPGEILVRGTIVETIDLKNPWNMTTLDGVLFGEIYAGVPKAIAFPGRRVQVALDLSPAYDPKSDGEVIVGVQVTPRFQQAASKTQLTLEQANALAEKLKKAILEAKVGQEAEKSRRELAMQLGERTGDVLLELAVNPKEPVRDIVLRMAVEFPCLSSSRAIISHLQDKGSGAQAVSGSMIQYVTQTEALPELIAAMALRTDAPLKAAIAKQIGILGSEDRVQSKKCRQTLAAHLPKAKDEEVAHAIRVALARLGDSGERAKILEQLKEDRIESRVTALHDLEYVNDSSLSKHFGALLSDTRAAFSITPPNPSGSYFVRVCDLAVAIMARLGIAFSFPAEHLNRRFTEEELEEAKRMIEMAGRSAEKSAPLHLAIAVSQNKWRWSSRQPFPVHVTVENRSNHPIDIPTYGGGVYCEGLVLDFKLVGVSGEERFDVPLHRPSGSILQVPADQRKRLLPRETWEISVNFNDWIPVIKEGLPYGHYELQAVWIGGCWDQDGKQIRDLPSSNVIGIELQ